VGIPRGATEQAGVWTRKEVEESGIGDVDDRLFMVRWLKVVISGLLARWSKLANEWNVSMGIGMAFELTGSASRCIVWSIKHNIA
jgi:hypothetical protein